MQLVEPRPPKRLPIRMTPLIDVVFILLVFFMLTSRLLPTSQIELENVTKAGAPSDAEPVPSLTLLGSGDVRWRGEDWSLPALTNELEQAAVTELNLSTEGEASLGEFTRVLTTLKQTGITVSWDRPAPGEA
ncbi:outer membrane transport energization protein ExbD [Tamilnaduibacter salinus]|uniref:Biopolymer transporter ExbD n=1 Tax=Tamilnaduibacter salinus TaxID=1484056 RepID=A0A2A2I149_9GAMM|nr:biopolymer transporter ExbD [Tamilnaduibacter salinus]PAV25138.1 biopolymer transporter ExbD [Tamilnaduibacter salinus]PVY76774.1 outer membrane transport energization protein ExbD [Tamilnaduibacter salinus]